MSPTSVDFGVYIEDAVIRDSRVNSETKEVIS